MTTPAEYTNTHLRCQLVVFMAENREFLITVLKEHIRGNYGHVRFSSEEYKSKSADGTITQTEIDDYQCPGPYSFMTYLQALLAPNFWGDEMVLIVTSMMWQVGITVLSAETLLPAKVCHGNKVSKSDILLVRSEAQHFVPAGEKCLSHL